MQARTPAPPQEFATNPNTISPQPGLPTSAFLLAPSPESHTLRTSNKPPDALHTEAVVCCLKLARRAILLTGTPSLSRPFDLFRQVDAVMPGLLGANRVAFAASYCNRREVPLPGGWPSGWMGAQALSLLQPLHKSWGHLPAAGLPVQTAAASPLLRLDSGQPTLIPACPAHPAPPAAFHGGGGGGGGIGERRTRFDVSGLSRGPELHDMLKAEVMLRRLKRDVLSQVGREDCVGGTGSVY
jgi:hypothetical protein